MPDKPSLPPEALDRLLSDIGKEYKAQIAVLRRVCKALEGAEDIHGRIAELTERAVELLDQSRGDDDNQIINDEIQEAVDWLGDNASSESSWGASSMDLEEISASFAAYLEALEESQDQLSAIVSSTPKRAFYLNREEEEEEDEDSDDEDEEDDD